MTHRLRNLSLAILACASTLTALAGQAQAAAKAPACFDPRDWSGWKASPDAKSIYIRVGVRKIYRLDMANACPAAGRIGVHLVTRLRGGSTICSPLDLDLKVSDGRFSTPCIVSGITALSDQEAATLPNNLKP